MPGSMATPMRPAADLGGYNPDGSAPSGVTLDGTQGDDLAAFSGQNFPFVEGALIGTVGDDTIRLFGKPEPREPIRTELATAVRKRPRLGP